MSAVTPERAIALLQDLIALPSVNPRFSDPDDLKGEGRVAAFLAERLSDLDFVVQPPTAAAGGNLIARFGEEGAALKMSFEAHLDTVGVSGMEIEPFRAEIRDGRIFGRGACDCKGPLASLLAALEAADLRPLRDAGIAIEVVGAVREESGNEGAEELARSGYRTDWLMVLEPTGLDVVHAHKGAFWFRVELRGQAAHGSAPEAGLSAIDGMLDLITAMRQHTSRAARLLEDSVLGPPTLNIGVIRGGDALNVVAPLCTIEADRRTLPAEDMGELEREILDLLAEMKQAGKIRAGRLEIIRRRPAFQGRPDVRLSRALLDACRRTGHPARTVGAAWYSDAGVLAPCAGQTVVFGPGSISDAHTARESIAVEQLLAGTVILRRFIEDLPRTLRSAEC